MAQRWRATLTASIALAAGAVHGCAFGAAQAAWLQLGGMALLGFILFRLRAQRRWGLVFACNAALWIASNALGLRWIAGAVTADAELGLMLGGAAYGLLMVGLAGLTVALLWAAVRLSCPVRIDAPCCALFAGAILAADLLREFFLPSFPWLYAGYTQLDAPFAALLPFVGVDGLGWVSVFTALLLGSFGAAECARAATPKNRIWTPVCVLLVAVTVAVASREAPLLTREAGTLRVALMQTAMPRREKFKASLFGRHLEQIGDFANSHDAQLIVTPETAVPTTLRALSVAQTQYLNHTVTASKALLFGAFAEDSRGDVFNSAVILQEVGAPAPRIERTIYIKQHLAPFGKYAPPGFKWITDLLALPMSNLRATQDSPHNFRLFGVTIIPSVCQDLLYGEDLRTTTAGPRLLVNLSNVEFFNAPVARAQFLNVARARALEQQVPVVIASNYGPTALIDAAGVVRQQLPSAAIGALEASVRTREGTTPYARHGNLSLWLLFALTGVAAVGAVYAPGRTHRTGGGHDRAARRASVACADHLSSTIRLPEA